MTMKESEVEMSEVKSQKKDVVFQDNFKFEKNKLIYYQTVKSNLRFILLKGQVSLLELFDVSDRNYETVIQKVSKFIPAFRLILNEAGVQISHSRISDLIDKLVLDTSLLDQILENLSKRITGFRQELIDNITRQIENVTPLHSPNPSGTTSFKTNMNGINPQTAAILLKHLPERFFIMLKKVDFSDYEILAIYDSKIAEAALLAWVSGFSQSNYPNLANDSDLLESIAQELIKSVISKINMVEVK